MQKLLLMKANYMKLWSAATYATIKYKSSRFDVSIFQENAHLLRQLHNLCRLAMKQNEPVALFGQNWNRLKLQTTQNMQTQTDFSELVVRGQYSFKL